MNETEPPSPLLLDCTLRDGGYYNNWDFEQETIDAYLNAMSSIGISMVELGFRLLPSRGFLGACAFTTDDFVRSLQVPEDLSLAVMVNASDILSEGSLEQHLGYLFPEDADSSPITMVRVACHGHELVEALPASSWLSQRGFSVGINLMQIADKSQKELQTLAQVVSEYPVDVFYFADSLGSLQPRDVHLICQSIEREWSGPIGIHAHDNKGLALSNTLSALESGATWLDCTVTGMGRGPGNTRTEELCVEVSARGQTDINLLPLLSLCRNTFEPMKARYGWGTNPYYYLSGLYGVHPTYVQEMLNDARYGDEDILASLEQLRKSGAKTYSQAQLGGTAPFYSGNPLGTWSPTSLFSGRTVLILGGGPGVLRHRAALERFIQRDKPVVVALNTHSAIDQSLIDVRIACHPVRLLADITIHQSLQQPLIAPFSMLPSDVASRIGKDRALDFGLSIGKSFEVDETFCVTPSSLVLGYSLAAATSGHSARILLAGFDGYTPGDPRNTEVAEVLRAFEEVQNCDLLSVTDTSYGLPVFSIYSPRV